MKSAAFAAACTVLFAAAAPAQDRPRNRIEPDLARSFEVVRRAYAEHGAIVDTAPDIHGERTTRQGALLRGRDACEWIVATDAHVTLRGVSPERYRYTLTIDLRALDPARIEPRPLRDWQWCCRRSAEVAIFDADGRQSMVTRFGESWSIADRGWLHFSDEGAARAAAEALARAVRACRRPGA